MTKGVWVPDTTKLQPGETPLYLHIVGPSQIILEAAVTKVNELIEQELGPLIDERTIVARNRALGLPPPESAMRKPERVKWPEQKLFIGLDSLRNFNVRAKTVGPGVSCPSDTPNSMIEELTCISRVCLSNTFRLRLEQEYRSRGWVQDSWKRRQGERQKNPCTSTLRELRISLSYHRILTRRLSAPNEEQVERARALAEDLLAVLRVEYEKARQGGGPQQPPQGGYQGYAGYQQQPGADPYAGYYQVRGLAQLHMSNLLMLFLQNGQGTPADGSQPSATPAAGGATPGQLPQQGTEAWNQYVAYWAAYGYDVNDPQCEYIHSRRLFADVFIHSPSMASFSVWATSSRADCVRDGCAPFVLYACMNTP